MQWIPSYMHFCHVFICMALQSFACMFAMCVIALPSFPIPSCSNLFQASQADDELDEACSCYNLCQASQAQDEAFSAKLLSFSIPSQDDLALALIFSKHLQPRSGHIHPVLLPFARWKSGHHKNNKGLIEASGYFYCKHCNLA